MSNSNSFLDVKVFTLELLLEGGDRYFSPVHTSQKIDYVELLKQAAHAQIDNPNLYLGLDKTRVEIETYYLPEIKISYREAEQKGLLDLFRDYTTARVFLAEKWLLGQDIWIINPTKSPYSAISLGITTTPATVLDFIATHADLIKRKQTGFKNTYILNPEAEATETND